MEHRLVPELTANIYYINLCVYNCDTFGVRVWRFLYRNKHTCDLCCYLPNMGSRAALDTIRLSDRSLTNVGETGLSIGFPLVTDYTAVSQNFFLTFLTIWEIRVNGCTWSGVTNASTYIVLIIDPQYSLLSIGIVKKNCILYCYTHSWFLHVYFVLYRAWLSSFC